MSDFQRFLKILPQMPTEERIKNFRPEAMRLLQIAMGHAALLQTEDNSPQDLQRLLNALNDMQNLITALDEPYPNPSLESEETSITSSNRQSSIVNRQLSMVVAMDKNRLIGADNGLPWRLPDDMKWFVEKTMGKPVIMGRKTYESIPAKFRPLKGRHNIVLTRSQSYEAPGATVVHSVEEALAAAGAVDEIIVGGGANLYKQLLPQTTRLYLTLIEATFTGDAFFPEIEWSAWCETFRQHHPADERHRYPFTWLILDRPM